MNLTLRTSFFLSIFSFAQLGFAQTPTIVTVAGGSLWGGYAGDGLAATNSAVTFFRTAGVCTDAAGNLYIADWGNYRIRKVSAATGIVETICGNGTGGFTGDGGPALAAEIDGMTYPMSLAIDNAGNIYYGDDGNNRIRKIDAVTGIINTVVGGGSSTASGVAATSANIGWYFNNMYIDASGNLYFTINNLVRVVYASTGLIYDYAGTDGGIGGFSGDGGQATAAQLSNPLGITGDATGNIYIADKGNNRIRMVAPSGVISTFSGNGTAAYTGDGGPASAAELSNPKDMGKDALGNIYVADGNGNYIRKIDLSTGLISTIAGCNSCSMAADMTSPVPATSVQTDGDHIFVDAYGNIYYSDYIGWVNKVGVSAPSCATYMNPGALTTIFDTISCSTTLYNTGCSPDITMQWQKSGDDISWSNISGATAASYSFSSIIGSDYYRCFATCPSSSISSGTSPTHIVQSPLMTQVIINPPAYLCTGPDFYVFACGSSTAYSVNTWFGDGSSNTVALTTSGVRSANVNHNYYHSGTYSAKQVLLNGGVPIDSILFSYHYNYCKSIPVIFYFDANNDCTYDSGDFPNNLPVTIEIDSSGVDVETITATSGFYYSANGAPGTVYTFRIISSPPGLTTTCPVSGVWTDTIQYYINEYPTRYIGFNCSSSTGFDLSVSGLLRFASHSGLGDLVINNSYCPPVTGTLTLNLSPKYIPSSGFGSSYSPIISGQTMTWSFPGLSATIGSPILLHMSFGHTGPLQPAGDTVHSTVTITPITGDVNPTNNIEIRIDTVKYAFDPNVMSVTPEGCVNTDTLLDYLFRFENDGNDTAHNIFVLDTLSDNIDPSTVKITSATHPMYFTQYGDAGYTVLKFDFPSINLLDSSHHEQCFGMVTFSARNKSGMPFGSVVSNEAGIYFDDNPVVMTNGVSITKGCGGILNVNNLTQITNVEVYPNPATDILNVEINAVKSQDYSIQNCLGQTFITGQISQNNNKINIENLPRGLYLLTMRGNDERIIRKFLKQ